MDSDDAMNIINRYLTQNGASLIQAQQVDERSDHHWHNSRHTYYSGGMIKYTMEVQFHDIEGFHRFAEDLEYVLENKNAIEIREQHDNVKEAYEAYLILLKLHGG